MNYEELEKYYRKLRAAGLMDMRTYELITPYEKKLREEKEKRNSPVEVEQ